MQTDEETETISDGRTAKVLRAWNGERQVARKIYKTEYTDSFISEYGILWHLNRKGHPNIIGLLPSTVVRHMQIDLEWRNISLYDLLQERRATLGECRRWKEQLIAGMAFMHENRVMHADVRPMNILLSDDGDVCYCDFGVSSLLGETATRMTEVPNMKEMYEPGEGAGSPPYRAPEVLLGSTHYGYEVDVWALGCVLLEILGGWNPMEMPREEEQMMRTRIAQLSKGAEEATKVAVQRSVLAVYQLMRVWKVLSEDMMWYEEEYRGLPAWGHMAGALGMAKALPCTDMQQLRSMDICCDAGIFDTARRCLAGPSERPLAQSLVPPKW